MPGRRPWKVGCTDGSPTSDVAAVMVHFFGHVGGEERTLGDFGVGGVSALAAPDHMSEAYLGDSGRGWKTGSGTKVFSERKLSALAPSAAMPMGIVTLLGAPMWLPSLR
jgi:hypothetical protein